MKPISSISNSRRILFLGAVLLFALGIFSPQHAEARVQQMLVPVYEGDPTGGLDSSHGGGASGGDQPNPPLNEGKDCIQFGGFVSSSIGLHTVPGNQTVILFDLIPYFDGLTMIWTITCTFEPMMGGGH